MVTVITSISWMIHYFFLRSSSGLTDDYVDFNDLADLWLSNLILQLDKFKNTRSRRRKIYALRDLNYCNVKLASEDIEWLLANCQYTNTLDEMVSACIIGVERRVAH